MTTGNYSGYASGMEPSISTAVAKIKAWLSDPETDHLRIASDAGVDEKTIRLARNNKKWNPRADTLQRLETVMRGGSCPKPRRKRAA